MKPEFDDPLVAEKEGYPFYLGINDLVQINSEEIDPSTPDLRPVLLWDAGEAINSENSQTLEWEGSDVKGNHVIWVDLLKKDGKSLQWSQPLPQQSTQK
jgi:hypothetical protein